ncbi:hypothetical protein WICMUC_005335 [Wickerhamomyces mucosus]|uniref:Uncharacterized protein n=1 Tax=Wickerhamomyces mucosus TaxID=1378264 RepID=A0A9P8P7I5_9ASCO|nr:hypothetical protein WICMUC_005335 [Wickerhamomyces mucosus]
MSRSDSIAKSLLGVVNLRGSGVTLFNRIMEFITLGKPTNAIDFNKPSLKHSVNCNCNLKLFSFDKPAAFDTSVKILFLKSPRWFKLINLFVISTASLNSSSSLNDLFDLMNCSLFNAK